MGQLRSEPKRKLLIEQEQYDKLLGVLHQAQGISEDNNVFWDLDEDEDPVKTRKEFVYVAKKADVPVIVRRIRNTKSLTFLFLESGPKRKKRMSVEECKRRILTALSSAGEAMSKSEIVSTSDISASTWNIRIRELLTEGKVKRVHRVAKDGQRGGTVYALGD